MTNRAGRPKEYFENRITTAIRIPPDVYKRLKHEAIDREVAVNVIVNNAINDWLKKHQKRGRSGRR